MGTQSADWSEVSEPMVSNEVRFAHVTLLVVARSWSWAAGTSRQAMPPDRRR